MGKGNTGKKAIDRGNIRVHVGQLHVYTNYKGVKSFNWWEGTLTSGEKEFDKPLSIITVQTAKQAHHISACDDRLQEDPLTDCVVRVQYAGYNSQLKKYIVAFDRFDCFLGQENHTCLTPDQLKALKNPRYHLPADYKAHGNIPPDCLHGTPQPFVKDLIIDLLKTLDKMVKSGMFSSWIGFKIGYVWRNGKLMILMLDVPLEEEFPEQKQREKTVMDGLVAFGEVVVKYLLQSYAVDKRGHIKDWKERDTFLEFFDGKKIRYHKNLIYMIYTLPFLKGDAKEAIEIFSYVYHCQTSGDHGFRKGIDVTRLKRALNNPDVFCSEFCEPFSDCGWKWIKSDVSPTISVFLRSKTDLPYPLPKDTDPVLYDGLSMPDFLKFLRKVFEHYGSNPTPAQEQDYTEGYERNEVEEMDAVLVYIEIMKNWPRLLHVFHQALICGDVFFY